MEFIDTHCHLSFKDFKDDLSEVLQDAKIVGVTSCVCVATDFASSVRCREISTVHDGVFMSIGLHPCYVSENFNEELAKIASLISTGGKIVAIGECGLDYYHKPPKSVSATEHRHWQIEAFAAQCELAAANKLPLIIHARGDQQDDCHDDLFGVYNDFVDRLERRAVFHCFSSDLKILRKILDLGALVSFTGVVTYKSAVSLKELLRFTPADRYMLETDAPYLVPQGARKRRVRRCEPKHIIEIAEFVADARRQELSVVAAETSRNARAFFHM